MTKIDYDTAVRDVQKIIKGREDYVYVNPLGQQVDDSGETSCMYFDPSTGAPSCIVGHVFAKHGVTFDDVASANDNCILDAAHYGNIDIDHVTRYFLEQLQGNQDVGVPWGDSYRIALNCTKKRFKNGD